MAPSVGPVIMQSATYHAGNPQADAWDPTLFHHSYMPEVDQVNLTHHERGHPKVNSWPDRVATAVVSSLADVSPGPERTKALGAVCAEIMTGISQIQCNLTETGKALEAAQIQNA